MPKLLEQVRAAIRTRHYSLRTEDSYINWIKRFIIFNGKRHPSELGAAEVSAFLSDLAVNRKVAASTQNQALAAILFLYGNVLKQELPWLEDVERAKRPTRVPTVFTREEASAVLLQLRHTTWLMASLLYGSGLRLRECLTLRVKDLDFQYRQIVVRDAKGAKDRKTILPLSLIDPLKQQLLRVKALHQRDLRTGFGEVYLPYALARKYPNAGRDWIWQYVFPSVKLSGHALRADQLPPRSCPRPPKSWFPSVAFPRSKRKFYLTLVLFRLPPAVIAPGSVADTFALR